MALDDPAGAAVIPGFAMMLAPKVAGGTLPTVTWNPSDKSTYISLSTGNLIAQKTYGGSSTWDGVRATVGKSSGKHYFEVLHDMAAADNNVFIGVMLATPSMAGNFPGKTSTDFGMYSYNGDKYTNSTLTAYGSGLSDLSVIGVCVDLNNGASNGTIEFIVNGVSLGVAFTTLSPGTYFPAVSMLNELRYAITGRFRAADFSYTPPAGFSPWGG